MAAVTAYREAMRKFAEGSHLAVWYAHLDLEAEMESIRPLLAPNRAKGVDAALAKARTKDSSQAFEKLATVVDGEPRIVSDPPLIVRVTELLPDADASEMFDQLRNVISAYRESLPADRRHLLEEYRLVDMARKVVGVGSVGTRAWILLMEGIDSGDPLFLQAKEAQASVLEEFAGASMYSNHGQRVVAGQHLMQGVSDIFLGWQRTRGYDGIDRDFYVRQLRDWKGSADPEAMIPSGMSIYAGLCGWTLARAHARSGDRVAIASYLGGKSTFDEAIADFASAYADLNERDYAALQAAHSLGPDTGEVRSIASPRAYFRMFTARAMTSPKNDERSHRLDRHRQFGPASKRHHVGRTERDRIREGKVEIVEELGAPSGSSDLRIEVLRKCQIRILRCRTDARFWTPAVKLPVEEGERDDDIHPRQCAHPKKLSR